MEFIVSGVNFGHGRGEFCRRRKSKDHFISFFRTDYLYESNGEIRHGSKGDVLIIPRGEAVYHGPTPDMKEGFRNDWVYIRGDDFIEVVKKYRLPIGVPFQINGSSILTATIEKIESECAFKREGHAELCDAVMRECIIEIAREYKKSGEVRAKDRITALREELVAHPEKDLSLKEMAETCGYSQSRFSSLYKEFFGTSPTNDLLNIRIEKAKRLLIYSSMQITEIAEEVGFSTVFHFSKFFKKTVGITPTEYKKTPN